MMTILAIIAVTHLGIMILAFVALIIYATRPSLTIHSPRYEKLYLNDNISGGGRVMGDVEV